MVKAALIRRKPKKAPQEKAPKKVSAEQMLSDEVPKILSKYKGKTYNLSSVNRMVKDLQQVVVRACCVEPSWQKQVASIHYAIMGKTLLVPSTNGERSDGVFFVSAVGIFNNDKHDTLSIDGVFAKFADDGTILFVRPTTWHYPLRSTCVRDGKLRVFFERDNYYAVHPILNERDSKNAKNWAKMALVKLDRRLDEF